MWSGRRLQGWLLVGLVLLGVGLRVVGLESVGQRSPDEYTYTEQVNTLLEMGTAAGYPVLFARFAEDTARPSPTRFGYHWLLMAAMRLTGDRTPAAGAALACLASVLSLMLVALLGWRYVADASSGAAAVVAALLYAVSPAELVIGRRCWAESLVELLTLASLWVACGVTRDAGLGVGAGSGPGAGPGMIRWAGWRVVAFAVVGALAFAVKETAAVGFLLAAVWIGVVCVGRRAGRMAAAYGVAVVAAGLLAAVWAAVQMGGFRAVGQMRVVGAKAVADSAYGLGYESGPGWLLVQGLWVLSAVTLVLAVMGAVRTVVQMRAGQEAQRWKWQVLLGFAAVCVVLLGAAMVLPQRLNFRYVCGMFGPLALLAGAGFEGVLQGVRRWLPAAEAQQMSVVLVVLLAVLAGLDYREFAVRWTAPEKMDLSIRMVMEAGGMVLPVAVAPAPVVVAGGTPADAAGWVARSAELAGAGRNEEAIVAAQRALALDPRSAVAWNNIAAADENLRRWDAAIGAAQQALVLQPGFQLAKNNLAWAMAQKAQGGR